MDHVPQRTLQNGSGGPELPLAAAKHQATGHAAAQTLSTISDMSYVHNTVAVRPEVYVMRLCSPHHLVGPFYLMQQLREEIVRLDGKKCVDMSPEL